MAGQPRELGEAGRPDALLMALGPVTGKRVIDMGCGEGLVARAFAAAGAEVRGYDPFIASGEWTDEGAGRYRLAQAKAQAIPEEDASADIVVFCYSLHHIPRAAMGAALAEARRVVKPGGRLCVAEPLAEGPSQYVMELYHDETEVRRHATAAIAAHVAPYFEREDLLFFDEVRDFADFEAYLAQATAGMRYNGYTEDQLRNPELRRRFGEVGDGGGARLAQRARINLFS